MTLEQALRLGEGDYVTHAQDVKFDRDGVAQRRPIRVTATWVNEKKTIVRIRVASVAALPWLDAQSFELPPAGHVWDKIETQWVTHEEMRKRKRARAGERDEVARQIDAIVDASEQQAPK